MKKYVVAALLSAALVTPSIAQTAPKRALKSEQTAPATLDDVVNAELRTNKLVAGVAADVTALRAASATIPRKSALYVDVSKKPIHIPSPAADPAVLANSWCVSIHYAAAKLTWYDGDNIYSFVCYD